MSGRVVAVLGISGVGKTTMVSVFTRLHPWIHGVRASALLKEAATVTDVEALRTVSAPDIHANQERLTAAFSDLRRRHPERHIIFDGHSLIDNDQGLVIVPTAVFVQLAPNRIVFIEDDAEAILTRRLADASRVRPRRSAEEILIHQQAAKEAAFSYAVTLAIPFSVVTSGDRATFAAALEGEFDTCAPNTAQ